MRKGSRPKKKQTQAKMIHAAVTLFLEKGYRDTRTAEISEKAGFSSAMFFSSFPDKEAVLYALIGYMFDGQFAAVEQMLGEGCEPVLLYSVETALQLHITELSEALRDLYVTAYSLPTTSEYIYKKTSEKLTDIFGSYLPGYAEKDFYELEIASAGIIRGYMARPCDMYFTIAQKISRFLDAALKLYEVPGETREQMIEQVLSMDLHSMAETLIRQTEQRAENGFEQEVEKDG